MTHFNFTVFILLALHYTIVASLPSRCLVSSPIASAFIYVNSDCICSTLRESFVNMPTYSYEPLRTLSCQFHKCKVQRYNCEIGDNNNICCEARSISRVYLSKPSRRNERSVRYLDAASTRCRPFFSTIAVLV